MGSRALERSGHRVVAYDARGHGQSSPAPVRSAYTYDDLGRDLVSVLDARGIDRAVLAGASMGAHTLLWLALHAPERVGGLVVITPAYDPSTHDGEERFARWDALADGLESGGIDGFVAAQGDADLPESWQETVEKVTRQRLSQHSSISPPSRTRCGRFRGRARSNRFRGPRGHLRADGDRGERRRARSWPSPGRGGGLRRRDSGRASRARRARPFADRVARKPAVQGDRGGGGGGVRAMSAAGGGGPRDERRGRGGPAMSAAGGAAGYSGTPLPRKLGIKPDARVGVDRGARGLRCDAGRFAGRRCVRRRLGREPFDVIVAFFSRRSTARASPAGAERRARSRRGTVDCLAQARVGSHDRCHRGRGARPRTRRRARRQQGLRDRRDLVRAAARVPAARPPAVGRTGYGGAATTRT